MFARAVPQAIAGIAILSIMDAVIKNAAARYPTFELTFARFLFGGLVIAIVVAYVRPGWPSPETLRTNGVRALLVVVTSTCFFYALSVLPLAETLALSFLSPIFMALFASAFLKERVDGRIFVALALGFCGMAVMVGGKVGGGFDGSTWGVIAALVSAVTYALSMVLLRARARHDPVVTIVAIQNIGPALLLAAPAAAVWIPPTVPDWGLFAVIGAMGVTGHLLLARAFARAEAARLAPLEYTSLLWAVALGYVFFGETPGIATLGGALLIVFGAIVASRR
jgi:drug/metabolite transporter (DMT)-like permease